MANYIEFDFVFLASAESERKRRRKSRWGAEETDKTFIPGMPTVLPTNLSKEQEEAYVCEYILHYYCKLISLFSYT